MLKVQEIREIIRLIDQSSINEFTYETKEATIVLKKSNGSVNAVSTEAVSEPVQTEQVKTPVVETNNTQVAPETPQQEDAQATESTGGYDYEIISPMVGTLYLASSPEKDPYVDRGSIVTDDSIVCIVEAMKLFNEIEAETTGEIVEILVEDGELVEYGQPLFRVKSK